MTSEQQTARRAGRSKRIALLLVLLGAGVGLIATMLPWVTAELENGGSISAGADVANPATLALSLAGLAAGAALMMVGRWPRIVLGVLIIAIGVAALFTAVGFDAAAAISRAMADELLAESAGGQGAADGAVRTFAPIIAMVGGGMMIAGGAVSAATAHRWQQGGRRFDVAREQAGASSSTPNGSRAGIRVDQWDALSAGDDPTLDADDASSAENSK